MSINIGPPAVDELRPHITVIGVGGAGGNAIANMIQADVEGVDFIVANTDAQALNNSIAEQRIQLGPEITQGLGAGSRPEVGRAAAEETLEEIERALDGVHMCFIAAGMGGGTGTGAAPVIAKVARDRGILTVGVVTKPFLFEGTRRMRSADTGIEELQKQVDTLIVIPNQNLFLVAKAETTFKEAFQLADEVLQQGVRSITDLMVMPGLINLDFADVRSVMGEMGKAMMGTGEGEGPNRALEAAERAISNPLLDGVSMTGAKGVIISIIGGEDMKLLEVDEAANHIRELVDPNANIIWGSAFNPDLQGKIRVSVVATGIDQSADQAEEAAKPFTVGSSARGPVRPSAPQPAPAPVTQTTRFPLPPRGTEVVAEPVLATWSGDHAEKGSLNGAAEPLATSAGDEAGAGRSQRAEDGASAAPGENGAGEENPLDLALEMEAGRAASADQDAPSSNFAPASREPVLSGAESRPVTAAPAYYQRVPVPSGNEQAAREGEPSVASREPTARFSRGYTPTTSVPPGGGTLFERMANLSRASKQTSAGDDDEESGGLSLPRFLGRR